MSLVYFVSACSARDLESDSNEVEKPKTSEEIEGELHEFDSNKNAFESEFDRGMRDVNKKLADIQDRLNHMDEDVIRMMSTKIDPVSDK